MAVKDCDGREFVGKAMEKGETAERRKERFEKENKKEE